MKLYGIVGAGGFGREVMPLAKQWLQTQGSVHRLVFIEEKMIDQPHINQYPIMTMAEFLSAKADAKYFNVAIANADIRQRIVEILISNQCIPFQIVATQHIQLDNNQIAEGAIFCPFTTVTSNTRIGKFFHANIYSYVAHDCCIGDYVTFAPNVHCNGGVIIEDHVYVGTGVIIKQSTAEKPIVIGKGAVLGMGAVVTKSVPPFATVVGNPARPLIKTVAETAIKI